MWVASWKGGATPIASQGCVRATCRRRCSVINRCLSRPSPTSGPEPLSNTRELVLRTLVRPVPGTASGGAFAWRARDHPRAWTTERLPDMAQQAIVGEKVGMTQTWVDDKVVPVTVLRVEPMRIVQIKTNERDGYTALQVTYGTEEGQQAHKPAAGHFEKAGVEPGQAPRRAAPRLRRRLRGRPGGHRRADRRRHEGRRHGHQPRQGLRRRHEASQLRGQPGIAR